MIELTGTGLAPDDVVAVARERAPVDARAEARARDGGERRGRRRGSPTADEPAYGVSTGFGSLANVAIPAERREELQRALVRSHAAGMGPPVEREVVRAMMLLRARTLAMGCSGARPGGRRDDARAAQRRASRRSCPSTARSARAATSRRSPTARWC